MKKAEKKKKDENVEEEESIDGDGDDEEDEDEDEDWQLICNYIPFLLLIRFCGMHSIMLPL